MDAEEKQPKLAIAASGSRNLVGRKSESSGLRSPDASTLPLGGTSVGERRKAGVTSGRTDKGSKGNKRPEQPDQ